ncbi:ShlB/FhaC/HecB family hemolysin secretion/activation protein [Desulfobacterales bacterium RS19-109]|uniref:ShlB/FhaC/HecB family hemolysin secretion/activation protein n=2 Tax=Thiovibrio frasassiensis TaxID=2984131 RepID=A0A9X4MHD1_9BACT|nr:ShlB/FhaC/HecB family hemolysin secretion/activation protein [Thiovibrio frasassiensis]MDG4476265.1 ShlB/FhaC/HecB family hemolysin secretion/activation protein [Thiovibrio frasassiensis]
MSIVLRNNPLRLKKTNLTCSDNLLVKPSFGQIEKFSIPSLLDKKRKFFLHRLVPQNVNFFCYHAGRVKCFLFGFVKPQIVRQALRCILLIFVIASMSAEETWSQTVSPTDAANQEFLRQQERERVLRQQLEQRPDVRLPIPIVPDLNRLPLDESPCFAIQQIVLEGDASEKFQWALAAANKTEDNQDDVAFGRCLGTRGINLVMRRVQNALVNRGYVTARVLAEPQNLSLGTLKLTLIPGRLRSIRFAPGTSARATQWNAVPASPGDLLNLRDIEQALENFKRVPTAEADIEITPAEGPDAQPGESDLVIQWKQGVPLRLSVFADDSGAKATGKYQGGTTLSFDHLLTLNDQAYLSFNHDLEGDGSDPQGTHGFTAYYSLPFGYWLLGFTTSSNRYYQTVVGVNQDYVYSGESRNSDIKLSRLVYRDAVRKTTLSLSGWKRSSQNYIDDTEVEVQRRRMAGWEAGIAHREFIGAATLDLNAKYRRGTGALNALPAPEEPFDEGTSRPKIVMADAQLNVPFVVGAQHLRYTGTWRAQWNHTPLVPQDRFAIGGRYTVRGFDGENLLSADRGWLIRNDLGLALWETGQDLYLGIDYGEVAGPSSEYLIGTRLTGGILGLRGGYKGLAYDMFIGQPLNKPDGFSSVAGVVGFNVNWSF